MASISVSAKAPEPATRLIEKPSNDSMASDPLPSIAEKPEVATPARPSDVSVPSGRQRSNPFDTDIEAMMTSTESGRRRSDAECRSHGSDCQVWPGQDHWRRKAKAAKMKRRNCSCLGRLSRRNRIIAKIMIGLLVVGIAIAVGVGVSKSLGAAIWRSHSQ